MHKEVDVIWLNFNDNAPNRGYWDQGLIEDILSGKAWKVPGLDYEHQEVRTVDDMPDVAGAVVVIPGRQQMDPVDRIAEINDSLSKLDWAVVIITGDEEGSFPIEKLNHSRMVLWIQTPRPGRSFPPGTRFLPVGYPPGTTATCTPPSPRRYDWAFMGQVTHQRRTDCIEACSPYGDGFLKETAGFTQGFPQKEYWDILSSARFGLCPGGPVTPDTFRLAESLELGIIPIADNASAQGQEVDYWGKIFGEVFFPAVDKWGDAYKILKEQGNVWKSVTNVVFSKWQQYKRKLAYDLADDISSMTGKRDGSGVTVLVATSPIESHPNTDIIIETLDSVRWQLPDAEIIVMFDGVRDEQKKFGSDYDEYVNRMLHVCNDMNNVVPMVFEEHKHQGVMTRTALDDVHTSTILFVEHDAPMTHGEIPWDTAIEVVGRNDISLLRFHHEAQVHPEHEYLMLDSETVEFAGLPVRRTVQWSQRPHLANADFYRWMCRTYFGWESRTMIEDVMYGVLETHHREEGEEGWKKINIWMYTPEGDIKRSNHTDGRGSESKYSLKIDYDGKEVPRWGPHRAVIET